MLTIFSYATISIIYHTFPSTIRALIGTLLVRVWQIIARAVASAIRPYEYQKRLINPLIVRGIERVINC